MKKSVFLVLACAVCTCQAFAQGGREEALRQINKKTVSASYCLTYSDFCNNRWIDAGKVKVKARHLNRPLASGKHEYEFKPSSRKTAKAIKRDALVVRVDTMLFINQQQLYHYASHFGDHYTPCFAIGDSLVFVGDMRFGDRSNEAGGVGAGATVYTMKSGDSSRASSSPTYGHINRTFVNPEKMLIISDARSKEIQCGVYCFMIDSNSILTKRLDKPIGEILGGAKPECWIYSKSDTELLERNLRQNMAKNKLTSKYREW